MRRISLPYFKWARKEISKKIQPRYDSQHLNVWSLIELKANVSYQIAKHWSPQKKEEWNISVIKYIDPDLPGFVQGDHIIDIAERCCKKKFIRYGLKMTPRYLTVETKAPRSIPDIRDEVFAFNAENFWTENKNLVNSANTVTLSTLRLMKAHPWVHMATAIPILHNSLQKAGFHNKAISHVDWVPTILTIENL